MSPKGATVAKPDKAEISDIAALSGFACRDALLICKRVPAVVPTSRLLVIFLVAAGSDLRRLRFLLLFFLDVRGDRTKVFVLCDRGMGDALLVRIEEGRRPWHVLEHAHPASRIHRRICRPGLASGRSLPTVCACGHT